MATINNKFVFFKNKAEFEARKADLQKTSIVFVKDTPIIWTQGVTYDVSAGVSSMAIWTEFLAGIDADNPAPSLADIKSRLEALEGINHDAYIAADSALETSLKKYADDAETDAIEAAKAYTDTEVAKKQDKIDDLETIRDNASAAMTWITSVTEEEDVDSAINKWSEIVDFLAGIKEPETLDNLLNDLRGKISTAQDAAKGAQTAANNAQTHSEGVADELSAFKTTVSTTYATQSTVNELTGVVSGKYVKPTTGIPSNDLDNSVQTALNNANSAVQPSAISDMATKTFTEDTYQRIGNYATVDQITDKFDSKGSAETAKNAAIAAAEAMWDWGYPEGE